MDGYTNLDTYEKGNIMDRKTLERENKQLQEGIDALRAGYGFHSFLISLLTMKAFYPETWYKSYDAKKLLESLDFHIERVGKTGDRIATPVGIGAMHLVYHERIEGQPWPTYEEILVNLKNELIFKWDGVPVKRRTLDDIEKEQEEAELKRADEDQNKTGE